jgi:hypothetical protein
MAKRLKVSFDLIVSDDMTPNKLNDTLFERLQQDTLSSSGFYVKNIKVLPVAFPVSQEELEGAS